jgi:hypothetical protein
LHAKAKGAGLALIGVLALSIGLAAQAQVKRAKGWVRDPRPVIASIPLMLRFRDYLPEQVDLSARFPKPGDQGQQSSCTAWATGYALRSYHEGQRRKWGFASPGELISPAYIYNRLTDFNGNCDVGTSIIDALNLLKNEGAPTLAMYPYVEDDCRRPLSPALARAISEFRINGWSALDNRRLDDIKGQLAQGNPVVFGIEVSDEFENWVGNKVYDDTTSPRTGGHAMVIVGYDERRQAFKVVNSWGTNWGSGGFGWVSYRAMRQLSDVMFVMDVPPAAEPEPAQAEPPVVRPPRPRPSPKPVVVEPPAPAPDVTPQPAPEPVVPPPVVTPPRPAPKPVIVEPPEPAPPVVTPPKPAPQPAPKPVIVEPPVPAPRPAPPVVTPKPAPAPKPVIVEPPAPAPSPAPPVVTPAPKPKPAVLPPVAAVQAQVAARLREVRCARLDGAVGRDRTVRLRGFAGSAKDIAQVQADLLAMPGVSRIDAGVTLYPWPQCEVFLNFGEPLTTPRGLRATLVGGASANVFREGDSLAVQVVTPSYPSYLYVTYLQASGDAVNLYWPQGRFPRALPPNTKVTFGGGQGGEPVYRITRPVGDEIVVVIASASPLFAGEMPETATDRDYLTSFRKAFLVQPRGGGGKRVVSALALPLRTQTR